MVKITFVSISLLPPLAYKTMFFDGERRVAEERAFTSFWNSFLHQVVKPCFQNHGLLHLPNWNRTMFWFILEQQLGECPPSCAARKVHTEQAAGEQIMESGSRERPYPSWGTEGAWRTASDVGCHCCDDSTTSHTMPSSLPKPSPLRSVTEVKTPGNLADEGGLELGLAVFLVFSCQPFILWGMRTWERTYEAPGIWLSFP